MKPLLYKISRGFARKEHLPIYFVGVVLAETAKAFYIYGQGTLETQRMGVCCVCGRELTHPVSVELGIGPECGRHWWDWDMVGGYTKKNIERLREIIRSRIEIDCWLPKAVVIEQLKSEETVDVPPAHPKLNLNKGKFPEPSPRKASLTTFRNSGDQTIKVEFPYGVEDLDRVRSLLGRKYHSEPKLWTAQVCSENVEKLDEWGFEIDIKLKDFIKKTNIHISQVSEIEVPGLKKELFPFQKKGVAFIEAKDGRALIGDEMGLGKTMQALGWLQLHPEKRPVIIVVPASLKLNWAREIEAWMSNAGLIQILHGTTPGDVIGDIIIINYDILTNWVDKLLKYKPQVMIIDECFPAGTKITTPNGFKKIEELKEGEKILNAIGEGVVEKIKERRTHYLIRLHLSNKSFLDVTPNHLFFTTAGWISASSLLGKTLLEYSNIFNILPFNIRTKIFENEKNKEKMQMVWRTIPINVSQKTFLQQILLSEMESKATLDSRKDQQKTNSRKKIHHSQKDASRQSSCGSNLCQKHERKQSNTQSKNSRKNQSQLEKIWTSIKQTTTSWRKWTTATTSTKNFMGRFRSGLESRISNKNKTGKIFRIPKLLQSRYCFTKTKNMDRSRWLGAYFKRRKSKRQEKRTVFDGIRVERIEILESRNTKQSKRSTVYNLQVSGHPSYYAGGFLVHNCHYVKSNSAKRTKAVKKLGKNIPHVIALSGTPIVNRPIEIFNAVKLIDNTVLPDFWDYTKRYCGAKHNGFGWDFSGATNTEELHHKLTNTLMMRRKKVDVLPELPEKVRSFIPMELDNPNEYRKAENDFISFVKAQKGAEAAERASNAHALAKIEGLKQLAVRGKLNQAVKWIQNFLDVDGKLVVFTTHTFTIDALMDEFSAVAVRVDGSVTGQARQNAVDKFQTDPLTRLFVGNVKAAGVGITLTAASNVAFLELPWSPADVTQAEDRCHRIGQKDSVTIHYLLANNTIEEKIAKLIDSKRKVLDAVLDGKKTEGTSLLSELMNEYE